MKLSVSTYIQGTIVNVEYPFHDKADSKMRPAIVVSYDAEHTVMALLQVTSHAPRTQYDYTIREYDGTGLTKTPSVVRCDCLFLVPNTEMLQKKGTLSRADLNAVTILYKQAYRNKATQIYGKKD